MKQRFTLLLFAFGLSLGTVAAQQKLLNPLRPTAPGQPAKIAPRKAITGQEPSTLAPVSVPQAENLFVEQIMGYTFYDLQSNANNYNRMHLWPDGRVSGVWTQSLTGAAGYPDRGTGYNKSDQQRQFPAPPTARVEAIRTGFPNYVVTSSGEEWIFSHGGTPNKIHYARKADAAATWTEGDLPDAAQTAAIGHLWSRAAVGGNDGQTLHVIALTTPTGNGGQIIDGLNGQLRYWRSSDGGTTWDIQDVPVPGIDTTVWNGISADAYDLDANGETVAILISDLTNDVMMIKSTDNGTTWAAPRLVNDVPLEDWEIDNTAYTFNDVGASFDPNVYPDSLAIFTSDETGKLLVDALGMVHVVYPSLFIQDLDTTDGQYTWYPTYNLGLVYWNDGMDDNYHGYENYIAYSPDLDESDTTGLATFESPDVNIVTDGYGDAFNTGPTLGMDDEGRLYITWITSNELAREESGEYHHHAFTQRSEPNDYSQWSLPEPVLQAATAGDPIIVSLSEYYFPNMAKRVDDAAHIQLQHDFTFGITLRFNPAQAPEENTIEYIEFPTVLYTVGTKDIANSRIELAVLPNPVSTGQATLLFELTDAAETQIQVIDLAGRVITSLQQGRLNSGHHTATINTASLNNGLYFVRVQAGNRMGMKKLVVANQ